MNTGGWVLVFGDMENVPAYRVDRRRLNEKKTAWYHYVWILQTLDMCMYAAMWLVRYGFGHVQCMR